jgi:hypothetical protein
MVWQRGARGTDRATRSELTSFKGERGAMRGDERERGGCEAIKRGTNMKRLGADRRCAGVPRPKARWTDDSFIHFDRTGGQAKLLGLSDGIPCSHIGLI